jgi:addiction module RelE/StbE family toxin
MKTLVLSSSFERAFKSKLRQNPELEQKISQKLEILVNDPFHPSLRTHKLKGSLSGAWSFTIDYDCRIVFKFVTNKLSGKEEILLINIGSHDEVY